MRTLVEIPCTPYWKDLDSTVRLETAHAKELSQLLSVFPGIFKLLLSVSHIHVSLVTLEDACLLLGERVSVRFVTAKLDGSSGGLDSNRTERTCQRFMDACMGNLAKAKPL